MMVCPRLEIKMGVKNLETITNALIKANESNWEGLSDDEKLVCISFSPLAMLIAIIMPDKKEKDIKEP
jgi:hypothetical protein